MPATLFSGIELSSLAISDVTVSSKGAKSAPIQSTSGKPVALRLPRLRAPFGATCWDDNASTRRNLDLTDMSPDLIVWLQALDEHIIKYVTKHSTRLFKAKLSEDQVRAQFTSLLKPGKNGYGDLLRCKVNLAGSNAIRVWGRGEDGALYRKEMPSEDAWRNSKLECVCTLSSLWIQAKAIGLVLTITDAILEDSEEQESPL